MEKPVKLNATGKKELQKIIAIVHNYSKTEKSKTFILRESLIKAKPSSFEITIKKVGDYEYFVEARISQERFSWLALDGTAQERIENPNSEILKKTICLTDIFYY